MALLVVVEAEEPVENVSVDEALLAASVETADEKEPLDIVPPVVSVMIVAGAVDVVAVVAEDVSTIAVDVAVPPALLNPVILADVDP